MTTTVRQLADMVGGEVHGDAGVVIHAARPLGDAAEGDVTFLEETRFANKLRDCRASAVVVPTSLPVNGRVLIRVANPLGAFATIVRALHGLPDPTPVGVDPRAVVHPTARLGEGCDLYPLAVVGEGSTLGARCRIHSGAVIGRHCRLGDDVVLYPNAVLYDGTVLGDRVMIHANAVLGADGFGYRTVGGRHVKVPQLGHVEVGDDAEVGACTTIDRGTFQPTRIGAGTKIDNLVMIGHNCRLGRHNVLAGQVGLAGSCTTGDYVVMAGQVGVADHVTIGDGAVVGGSSAVVRDVPPGSRQFGSPAGPAPRQRRVIACLERLPEMRKDVLRLLQHLGIKDES